MSVGFMANKKELLPQPTPVLDCRWEGFRGLGVVVRNCNGNLLWRLPNEFEVASKMGYESLVLEMDAQEIIRCSNASEECLDSDGALVAEAQAYLKLFPVVICQYASCSCNQVVHRLARISLVVGLVFHLSTPQSLF
ncbi:unnamed protein product [Prunus armeniaca]|uniref:RNase H type-1 domain-containing protein n=1 Tax=Prunus armeniaca TaxID=36596 RepID=A0A6J5U8R1_PRUAR|nr:unnamed protein product [Prunus armeniaca]